MREPGLEAAAIASGSRPRPCAHLSPVRFARCLREPARHLHATSHPPLCLQSQLLASSLGCYRVSCGTPLCWASFLARPGACLPGLQLPLAALTSLAPASLTSLGRPGATRSLSHGACPASNSPRELPLSCSRGIGSGHAAAARHHPLPMGPPLLIRLSFPDLRPLSFSLSPQLCTLQPPPEPLGSYRQPHVPYSAAPPAIPAHRPQRALPWAPRGSCHPGSLSPARFRPSALFPGHRSGLLPLRSCFWFFRYWWRSPGGQGQEAVGSFAPYLSSPERYHRTGALTRRRGVLPNCKLPWSRSEPA